MPGNKGETTAPTAAVVLESFAPVTLVYLDLDGVAVSQVYGWQAHHRLICEALGVSDSWADCTRAQRRTLTVRPQKYYMALQGAREREASAEYQAEYARRAGVEGTLSQGVRTYGLRRVRYFGEAKTFLQHVLTAAAINFVRMGNWLMGTPLARTRTSAFERVMKQCALC